MLRLFFRQREHAHAHSLDLPAAAWPAGQPPLLIFDEATSALDSLTEQQITNTVRALSAQGQRITILIAHRLSTVMHADTICVLEKGRIVESGRHADLLEQKGLYYAMWRQQIGERPGMPAPAFA